MSSLAWFVKVATCLIVVQTWLVAKGLGAAKEDKIRGLPGQPAVKFDQYSGTSKWTPNTIGLRFTTLLKLSGPHTPSHSYYGSVEVYNQAVEKIGDFVSTSDVLMNVCLSPPQPVSEGGLDVCIGNEVVNYFNRKDVQQALHANLVGVKQWISCTGDIGYNEDDILAPTLHLLGALVKGGVRVLAFSGDQDAGIPFIGTRRLLSALAKELTLNTTMPYGSWLHNKQVGGWAQVYGDVLSFATVRGGGHVSGFDQPERTLALIKIFLQGSQLPAPPPSP